jgi:hypothetical protein
MATATAPIHPDKIRFLIEEDGIEIPFPRGETIRLSRFINCRYSGLLGIPTWPVNSRIVRFFRTVHNEFASKA